MRVSPLSGPEWAVLREQVATTQAVLRKRYGGTLTQGLDDLALIQRLVDDKVYDDTDVEQLRCMGAVVGNVLVKELGFEWKMVEDERGTEAALERKGPKRTVMIHPLRLITGRVAANLPFEVAQIYRDAKADVARSQVL